MDTLAHKISIKETPIAIATLDNELCFINCSQSWLKEFIVKETEIIGKSFFDVIPNTPSIFRKTLENSFRLQNSIVEEQRHLNSNGSSQWYQWNIKPWKQPDNTIGGLVVIGINITENKRIQELLLATENITKMGGWDLDMITNKVYWSNIIKEIYELPLDFTPCSEVALNFYKEGEDRENIIKLFQNATLHGQNWDAQVKIITAKGNERWVRTQGKPEFANGKCVRLYGIFQDIDKKKKAEIKAAQIKERLDLATKVANIGIWEYNIPEDKLEWNNEMFLLFGVKQEDFNVSFKSWENTVHPDDIQQCLDNFDLTLAGLQDFKTQFRVIHPDGSIKHIKANGGIFKDNEGKVIKIVGTNWDITELVNTQLQLQKSEESFKGAFESSAVGMAIVGLDGRCIDANNNLCVSLGYSKEELLKLSFQEITHPESLTEDEEHFQALMAGKYDSYQIEKRYLHRKGHSVYVVLTVTAIKDMAGNISHFISQVMDISDKIKAQKESERLMMLTNNQNNSLLNFAHIVSHNLRSHSSNLTMLSQYLIQEKGESERKEIEEMIVNASESLSETVLHLNEVVQIATQSKRNLQHINLYKIVKNVEKNISALLQQKNVECEISINPSIKVKGIHAYLDSIFLNLFTNSIKYSSPNRQPKISIYASKIKNNIILNFKDNGLGIDLERHGKKLFGMYKTFHKHKDAKGIGLFITKNQIEAMQGKIEVESVVNQGTLFKITLISA